MIDPGCIHDGAADLSTNTTSPPTHKHSLSDSQSVSVSPVLYYGMRSRRFFAACLEEAGAVPGTISPQPSPKMDN